MILRSNLPTLREVGGLALENLAGKGAPPAELKSLAPMADPAVSPIAPVPSFAAELSVLGCLLR
jgi:hypothetical protein